MYEEYFGLSGPPFKLNPDPKFFFGSRSHNKAMAYLHYGLKQAEGFIVITGPVGAGKSTAIGHLLDQLDRSNIVAAQLLTTNVAPDELLEHILSAFRIEPENAGRTGQLEAFEDYLFDQLHRGRRVLLIMDEAQNLPDKTLEELRMLSNLDYDGTPLFQVFLVGQPEFRDTLLSDRMEQLKQRVIASYHLENLSREETQEYILHRLSVVGWNQDPVFTDEAFDAIYAETGGRPRRINTLCNRLMLHCSLEQLHEVDAEVLESVISELHEEKLGSEGEQSVEKKPEQLPKPTKVDNAQSGSDESIDRKSKSQSQDIAVEVAVPVSEKNEESAGTATPNKRMSVLDRLREGRSQGSQSDDGDERHEATLTDVASAIVAASADTDDKQILAPGKSNKASSAKSLGQESWRKGAERSIDDVRNDLKEANANLRRLRGMLDKNATDRREKGIKIADALANADGIIDELRHSEQIDFKTSMPPAHIVSPDESDDVSNPSNASETKFALSVDVEDYFQVWAFSEKIKRDSWHGFELRVGDNTRRCLDLFDQHDAKATFFMLGWVAERDPALAREIVERGHELASHGYDHTKVNLQTRSAFREDATRSKNLLEDLAGTAVTGYRAAGFSIDASTPWAHETLAEIGYRYSSSSHPIAHDHYGDAEAPQSAYCPIDGDDFLEAPVATTSLFGRRVSCAGGGWFRAAPVGFSKALLRRAAAEQDGPIIFYFHPWEIDPDQPRISDVSAKSKFRHYLNIDRMEAKLGNILSSFTWRRIDDTLTLPAKKP